MLCTYKRLREAEKSERRHATTISTLGLCCKRCVCKELLSRMGIELDGAGHMADECVEQGMSVG